MAGERHYYVWCQRLGPSRKGHSEQFSRGMQYLSSDGVHVGGAVKISWSEDTEPSEQPRADDGRARPLRAHPEEREETGFCLALVCCFSKISCLQFAVSELPNALWVAISYQFCQRLHGRDGTKRSGATSSVHNGVSARALPSEGGPYDVPGPGSKHQLAWWPLLSTPEAWL